MTIIRTQNSTFELDDNERRFRRVTGKNPTALHVADGEWVNYDRIAHLAVGQRCVIEYGNEYIRTSLVAAIENTPSTSLADRQAARCYEAAGCEPLAAL